MKKTLTLIALVLSAHTIFAQQKNAFIDSVKDSREFNGYNIQLKAAPGNSFLFNLLKGAKPVFNPPINPLTRSPLGFARKEDAYRLAMWMVAQYGKSGQFPMLLPPELAKQLNLQTNISQN